VRLLDHHDVAGVEQDPRREIEALLRAAGDHDLLGVTHHPARPLEIVGECSAQRRVSGRVRIAEGVAARPPRPRGQEPPPEVARELVEGGLSVAKVVAETARARRRRAEHTGEPPGVRGDGCGRPPPRAPRRGRRRPRPRAHDRRGRAVPADDVAFGQELLVGQHDGVAGHPKVGGELAGGRQARRRREAPVADHRLEGEVDPAIERTVGRADIDEQHLAP
jgi:hypothetical protein